MTLRWLASAFAVVTAEHKKGCTALSIAINRADEGV